jgi:hypothetical protein
MHNICLLFQVRLELINDKLWKDLYWIEELTRPDRLAKILNLIIRKENDDSENFIYDRKAAKDAMKNNLTNSSEQQDDDQARLTYYDKLHLGQIDQQFESYNLNTNKNGLHQLKINTNNLNARKVIKYINDQHILSRQEVEKFLRELSGDVYLDDEIIKPRSINVRLVKIGKLNKNMKLFSTNILVRMQPNIYKLPVRCKPNGTHKDNKSKSWPMDRINRMESLLLNLSNQVKMNVLHNI